MKCSISNHPVVWVVAACAFLATLPAWADPPKIGIVDPQRLFLESPQGKGMLESLRAEFAPRERSLVAQGQALKAKQDAFQKNGATMSDEQRGRAEKDLRDGERDFERARGEYQDDVTSRRNEEMSRLQRTLVEEVRTYAKAQNYDVVLSGEAVLYQTPAYDITPAILAALQAHAGHGATGSATPPATPAAPAKPQSH
ncbi:MAG: OmpH family outer membrane protein [Steroidobacteraceae bacterium]